MKHWVYNFLVEASLKGRKKVDIVDYGCGDGFLLNFFPFKNINTYKGFDINKNSIKTAQKRFSRFKNINFYFINRGGWRLKKENQVDVIFCIGVLQYLTKFEIKKFLAQAERTLERNGILLISCTANHWLYRQISPYRFFLPHSYLDRKEIIRQIEGSGFKVTYQKEKGIFFIPIFSKIVVFFFDAIDKLFFRTSGSIGLFGRTVRRLANPILIPEYLLPIDFGETLIIKAVKSS